MPNLDAFAKLRFINRSTKDLQSKFLSKQFPAEAFQVRAKRRRFDIKSKRSRNGSHSCEEFTRGRKNSVFEHLPFQPFFDEDLIR